MSSTAPIHRPLWVRGCESARAVATLGLALALTLIVTEGSVRDTIGIGFDLGFVCLCVLMALIARPGDFILTGLLPAAVMTAAFALVGATSPGVIAHPEDGWIQATVTALGHHGIALFVGFASCSATLTYRLKFLVV
ncbi:MAG: DUF6542 domain-containing protein [Nocardioides sp.]